jgi:peptidoglycan hydrolase-like protein with peptidoglycan-binding domain
VCNYYVSNGNAYAGFSTTMTTQPATTYATDAGREAQCLLAKWGRYSPGTIDGIFGPHSQAAAKAFQTDMNVRFGAGLAVDGLVGPHTWPWLRWYQAYFNLADNCRPPANLC